MIYLISGNDNKKKNASIKNASKGLPLTVFDSEDLTKESVMSFASSQSLFGEISVFLLEDLSKSGIEFTKDELEVLSKSENIFIITEDKILVSDINKFKKFATIESFNEDKKTNKDKSINNFAIADSFAVRNKFKTWLLYKDVISKGVSPEEIAGILFWKIKTIVTHQNKYFTSSELKIISSNLISLYHDSHLGKKDFSVGLEQFILSSLDKKQKEKA